MKERPIEEKAHNNGGMKKELIQGGKKAKLDADGIVLEGKHSTSQGHAFFEKK